MHFIKPDDHILLMEENNRFTIDELKRFKSCGINTMLSLSVGWLEIERSQGIYDWGQMDACVERYNAAGMKVLIQMPRGNHPSFLRKVSGKAHEL